MHILVTGGTGFIGAALVPALLADGHALTLLTRHPERHQARLASHARLVARLSDIPAQARIEGVINLAGEGIADRPWTAARKQVLYESRVTLTRQLGQWLAQQEAPPAVMVSGSAIGWYGDQGDTALAEDAAPAPGYTHELCAAWEAAAMAAAPEDTRLCLVRTGVVLDRDGGMLRRLLPVFRAGLGGRVGSGRQWLSWVGREDMVAILRRLLADPAMAGVYNATAPAPVRNADFTRELAAALHRPAVLPAPALALKLALGEMSELLLGGQQVLPARLLEAGFVFRAPTLAECLRQTLG